MLNEDSALSLYRAAIAADSEYLPAQFEYITMMRGDLFRGPELTREYGASAGHIGIHGCLAAATSGANDIGRPITLLLALERRAGLSSCTDIFLIAWSQFREGSPEGLRDGLARGARLVRELPEVSNVWSSYASRLAAAGRAGEAERVLREGIARVADPFARFNMMGTLGGFHLSQGDTAGAVALWRAARDAVLRDGRPRLEAQYLSGVCDGAWLSDPTPAARERACREQLAILHAHHAWLSEWGDARNRGHVLVDRGFFAAALLYLNRAVALADSVGTPGLRLIAHNERGRVYSKLGRLALAERDLRLAIAAGATADEPYYLAEAYHNLAHTYEGAGRFAEAAGAADTFAALTAPMRWNPERMISRYDAGTIRWKAGWHAAAARDFAAMVRIVDEQGVSQYFAGEYYERVGDLGRALRYYRDGARIDNEPRSLAALARLYEALGLPDSAAEVARLHDARPMKWTILEGPLLPGVLARRGRLSEAIALSEGWARQELLNGNVEGAAAANLQLAQFQLQDHEPGAALTSATRADSLSRTLHLTGESIKAWRLEGRALLETGKRTQGMAALREAVSLARAHPTAAELLETDLALGDASRTGGDPAAALAAYDRAAAVTERLTAGLEDDPDRTGFRALHLAPFDGALRILLRPGAASSADAALRWSARRKGAALVLAGLPTTALHPPSANDIHATIGRDEALVDYTVLDSGVTAFVVGRRGATIVPLSTPLARLASWTEAIRRPLVAAPGGRVDLAHARFDIAAAESLFRALVAPLTEALGSARRLAIIPDGLLWYVPFPALVVDSAYLIDRYEVRLLPSAQFLTVASQHGTLPTRFHVLAMSYDVPGGAAEVARVRNALGAGQVQTLEGGAATEHAALEASVDVLHLAAHGLVDDRDPLASHLRLAPDRRDDGLLHVSEIAAQRRVPRLVVLSACESVSGRLYAGEGLVGLARAFLVGGARQVVASQWPVDSSAAALMGVFYEQLAKGHSPSAALREAQLALKARPNTAHPIHWAGFVVFQGGMAGAR